MTRPFIFAAAILLATGSTAYAQTPKRLRGTIQSVAGNVLTMQERGGDMVKIQLAPNYTVGVIAPTSIDKIKPGMMVGVVGFGPPGEQRAAVVSIFPPGAAVNVAQFPWDSQPDSVMTNAEVSAEVTANDAHVLTMTVKGEPVRVTVPPNAVVQETEPGGPSLLVPGAHVLIFAQQSPDGMISAPRVNVGKDGFTPAN